MVEAGDVLVRLDSSSLDQEKVQQQIICNTTEAQMIEAKNIYEAALIAKTEYIEGTYHQEQQLIKSEILIAEENLRRAREYVAYSKRLAARGYVTSQQLEGDTFAVEKAETELDAAQTKLRVLQDYTKEKMLKQLDSDIKSAEARWNSDQSSYQLELSKLQEIGDQIAKCTITAPQAGQVVYANRQSSRRESEFVVEPGALVRESQALIRLPDAGKMQVKAKINESRVTFISAGMPATIRMDAFGDRQLRGKVVRVNEYPEPGSWYSSQVKEYATYIKIANPPADIKPGLTAEVTIHVQRDNDVVTVPVQSIHEHGRSIFAMVSNGGRWEPREIEIGASNDKHVMVKSGLETGDIVAMNPRDLLDQVQLPELEEDIPAGAEDIPTGEALASRQSAAPQPQQAQRPAAGGFDAERVVGMIISRLDKNSDGVISSDEIPADQADRMKANDTNSDGKIERSELLAAMRKAGAGGGGPAGGSP